MAKTRLSALPRPSKRPQTGAVQTLRKFGRRCAEARHRMECSGWLPLGMASAA